MYKLVNRYLYCPPFCVECCSRSLGENCSSLINVDDTQNYRSCTQLRSVFCMNLIVLLSGCVQIVSMWIPRRRSATTVVVFNSWSGKSRHCLVLVSIMWRPLSHLCLQSQNVHRCWRLHEIMRHAVFIRLAGSEDIVFIVHDSTS